ncbi:hypothetical protein [Roseospirillum parvum]|uniref:Sel1 repeat family protein n=1 Tax=Roseospirillum parvum TaxID=83401 RepID=A0A1G8FH84_9PROT|nr:hypothetical protein [Roseospirillum parvum]SDH81504.1 hypothetical protein SAMN05421742_11419 [Roseospirillum parvum]
MRLWVFLLAMVMALPVVAEEVTCGPQGAWHDPAMEYHLDDLLALIEARLDWEEGKPRADDPGDPERVAAAVAAWQRLAEPHDGRPGNAEARWWLGHLMMDGKAGFEADAWGALEFLLPAAEAGHLEAMTQAGRILVREENAERLTPKVFAHDPAIPAPTKGRACLKRAAWLGNREAQRRWADLTPQANGEIGPILVASGLDLDDGAINNVATELVTGYGDYPLAKKLYARCAICGLPICQFNYGVFLGKFEKDEVETEEVAFWVMLASKNGLAIADRIVNRNTPAIKDDDWMRMLRRIDAWSESKCD